MDGVLLARIEAKSMFLEEIKVNQLEDGDLYKLKTNILMCNSQGINLAKDGVLNYNGKICVQFMISTRGCWRRLMAPAILFIQV